MSENQLKCLSQSEVVGNITSSKLQSFPFVFSFPLWATTKEPDPSHQKRNFRVDQTERERPPPTSCKPYCSLHSTRSALLQTQEDSIFLSLFNPNSTCVLNLACQYKNLPRCNSTATLLCFAFGLSTKHSRTWLREQGFFFLL